MKSITSIKVLRGPSFVLTCHNSYFLALSQKLWPQSLYHIPILPWDLNRSCIHRRSFLFKLPLIQELWTSTFLRPHSLPSDILTEEGSDISCLSEKKTHHYHYRIVIGREQSRTPSFLHKQIKLGWYQYLSLDVQAPQLGGFGFLTSLVFTRVYDAFWKIGTAKKNTKSWEILTKTSRVYDD